MRAPGCMPVPDDRSRIQSSCSSSDKSRESDNVDQYYLKQGASELIRPSEHQRLPEAVQSHKSVVDIFLSCQPMGWAEDGRGDCIN